MVNALYIIALMGAVAVLGANKLYITSKQRIGYCKIDTCPPRRHTLCTFRVDRPSVLCGKVDSFSLTDDEIKEIVDVHNNFYKSGQTPMLWDNELSMSAQAWANWCKPTVDECRNVERFRVAQSFSWSRTNQEYTPGISNLVKMNDAIKGSKLFGCGAIRYNPDKKFNTTYLVCNYADPDYSP